VPRILVVDDDADIRDMLSFKLAHAGYEVHTEEDGETGLAAAQELRPDVVLLDWMMPRMTGPEVCLALRQEPETARLPVILLTAKAQEADVQRGFATGVDDYVCKPFSPRELVSRVQALLARAA
jgi:two-component system phosphate regulon response regulator PhoB